MPRERYISDTIGMWAEDLSSIAYKVNPLYFDAEWDMHLFDVQACDPCKRFLEGLDSIGHGDHKFSVGASTRVSAKQFATVNSR